MSLKLNPKPDSGSCFAFITQEEIKQDRETNSSRMFGKEQIDLLITKQGDKGVCFQTAML